MASHTMQTSCVNGSERKYFLDKMYPNLCSVLSSYGGFFGNNSSCEETVWPDEFFRLHGKPHELIKEMHQYGRDNLALVNIFIQSPYVTKVQYFYNVKKGLSIITSKSLSKNLSNKTNTLDVSRESHFNLH